MKLALIYFCYKNDETMLLYSLSRLSYLRLVDDIDIYLVDDRDNLITIKDLLLTIIDFTYLISEFPRNGNLNGILCLKGMIDIYNLISRIKDYDWIIKIDADTIVNDFEWLRQIDSNYYCLAGSMNIYRKNKFNDDTVCHGCLHCISKKGLCNLNNEFNKLNLISYIDLNEVRFAEDYVSCKMICKNNNKLNYYLKNVDNNPLINKNDNGIYFDFKEKTYPKFIKDMPISKLKLYCAVTFKKLTKNNEKCDNNTISVRKRMEKYLNLLLINY